MALALVLASAASATVASFPDRPIKFISGFGAGGPTDIVARTLAKELSIDLGQNVAVENMVGATGDIATQAVANAAADGYTYLVGASPLAVNETLHSDLTIRFGRDLVAVAAIGATANVLVVRPTLNVRTLAEFVQRAREKPNGITYATLGIGSNSHLSGVALDARADTKMLPVVYHGVPDAVKDLLSGNVDVRFASIPEVLGAVQNGSLIALATTGPERSSWLPNVPTIAESGYPGFDVRLWIGIFARNGVPAEPMRVMEQAIARAMAADSTKASLERQGISPLSMSREEFTAFVTQEIARAKALAAAFKTDGN